MRENVMKMESEGQIEFSSRLFPRISSIPNLWLVFWGINEESETMRGFEIKLLNVTKNFPIWNIKCSHEKTKKLFVLALQNRI